MNCRETANVTGKKFPYHFHSVRNSQRRYLNEFRKMTIPVEDQFLLSTMVDGRKEILLKRKVNYNVWKSAVKLL